MALVIGLTGGMGVGKSTVAGLLAAQGASVIDVDGVGRSVLEPGGGAVERDRDGELVARKPQRGQRVDDRDRRPAGRGALGPTGRG